MNRWHRLGCRSLCGVVALFFIAACAQFTPAPGINDSKNTFWSGRLALVVQSEPVQQLYGGFELQGSAQVGDLTLLSPLGNALAQVRWNARGAQLKQGAQVQEFDSLDQLMQQLTGAPVPVAALFGWLRGEEATVPGWQADLSRLADGRVNAQRTSPLPSADLRIVLDAKP